MYKILVISDTHRKIGHVIDLIDGINDLDHIIHLGDLVQDAQDLKAIYDVPFDYVAGNCDMYDNGTPNHQILSIRGKLFYITHGHQEGVKYSLDYLRQLAKTQNYAGILFGHTHHAIIKHERDTIIVNPGSISEPRNSKNPTYAVIQIDVKGRVYATLNEYKKVF